MVWPGLIWMAVFSYVPLVFLYIAFTDYRISTPLFENNFVGLKHFAAFLSDDRFWRSVYNTLAQFTPTGGGLTGYSNALYATQLEASTHANGSTRCRLLGECERQLLSDCVVVPLFSQQKRLLIASGVKNLIFDPFGPVLDLTYATKE